MGDNIFVLNKAQVRKLIKRHKAVLNCSVNKEALIYIVLPKDVNDPVDVQDILGNSLGKITVKEAWAL